MTRPPESASVSFDTGGSIAVATWNVEWAERNSARGERVAVVLAGLHADVLVVTEGCAALLPADGHVIDAGGDWGYGHEPERRKVLAWSRSPRTDVRVLDHGAARGRVVEGHTMTPGGEIHVVAVCIPWRDAHVRSGRRDAEPWSEQLACCQLLRGIEFGPRSVIAGDVNQRIPRHRQPAPVAAELEHVLDGMTVWTAGVTEAGRLIDHIATGAELVGVERTVWPGQDGDLELSDHAGVLVRLRSADAR